MEIIDSSMIVSCGPPGGGRYLLTPRFIRHFVVAATVESDDKTLQRIFNTIIDWHIEKNNIKGEMATILKCCIDASIDVYV